MLRCKTYTVQKAKRTLKSFSVFVLTFSRISVWNEGIFLLFSVSPLFLSISWLVASSRHFTTKWLIDKWEKCWETRRLLNATQTLKWRHSKYLVRALQVYSSTREIPFFRNGTTMSILFLLLNLSTVYLFPSFFKYYFKGFKYLHRCSVAASWWK